MEVLTVPAKTITGGAKDSCGRPRLIVYAGGKKSLIGDTIITMLWSMAPRDQRHGRPIL